MKRIFLLIFTLLFLIGCTREYQPRNIEKVTIKTTKIDSSSIRTMVVTGHKSMSYAASNGTIGFTADNGVLWHTLKIRYQDSIIPHFRSFAYNLSLIHI